MKSRRHHQSAKRSRWAWNNSPDGLRNRRAKADARREAIAAALPPVYEGPAPLSEWQTITVTLYVPTHGRCDQHAAVIDGQHLMLLSTPTGRPVSATMLRDRYEDARTTAALKADDAGDAELAQSIRAMFLRDMRKRAADLAESDDDAQELLQHGSADTTRRHYRTKVQRLKPAR